MHSSYWFVHSGCRGMSVHPVWCIVFVFLVLASFVIFSFGEKRTVPLV